jgi:hypothetical protein
MVSDTAARRIIGSALAIPVRRARPGGHMLPGHFTCRISQRTATLRRVAARHRDIGVRRESGQSKHDNTIGGIPDAYGISSESCTVVHHTPVASAPDILFTSFSDATDHCCVHAEAHHDERAHVMGHGLREFFGTNAERIGNVDATRLQKRERCVAHLFTGEEGAR